MSDNARRSAAARLAVHASWARTPDRAARTRPATQASPVSVEYWVKRLAGERDYVSEADLYAAAVNARSAEMRRRARSGVKARARKLAARVPAADEPAVSA